MRLIKGTNSLICSFQKKCLIVRLCYDCKAKIYFANHTVKNKSDELILKNMLSK